MDKDKLKKIISELREVIKEEKLNKVSNSVLFDCAIRIYSLRDSDAKLKIEPITEKQKQFLIKNNYGGDIDSLSKEEARQLIKTYIENQKNV